jgi:hypothetical protein
MISEIDVEKETRKFKRELETGKFKIARPPLPNSYTAPESPEDEEREAKAFDDYLNSDLFKHIMNGCRE